MTGAGKAVVDKLDGQQPTWNEVWESSAGLNWFGRQLQQAQFKTIARMLGELRLDKDARLLDLGCGSGRSLADFRRMGYTNSIGIDVAPNSIKVCEQMGFKAGKDVFLMDGTATSFQNREFELVYSGGVIEHFPDFEPFIGEMTRISGSYVLLMQPNHFSLFRKMVDLLRGVPVDEYFYREEDYTARFEQYGFSLIGERGCHFNEQFALLYGRKQLGET
jgi:SAM-dependent methyltransferase